MVIKYFYTPAYKRLVSTSAKVNYKTLIPYMAYKS